MTPVEIDTELARIWTEIYKAQRRVDQMSKSISRPYPGRAAHQIERDKELLARYQGELQALRDEAQPYEAEYASRPWRRYFLVANNNGHVHRGMDCSTCFYDTQYNWLVDLADCDENAMIEEWGELACTVCFPSAPTNPFYNRPSRRDREAQAAREAEKAQRQAAKDAKAITNPDGTPLRGEYGVVATKIAARNELSSAIQNMVFYGPERHADWARTLIAALVPHTEIDWFKVATNAIKKAVKESEVPPNNPYRLTPEQITEHGLQIQANAATARDFLADAQRIHTSYASN